MPTIHPFIWFATEAEQARDFYLSVFKSGRALKVTEYTDRVSGPDKTVPLSTFEFELEGLHFTALNAGSHPPFNESLSFYIETKDQAETDYYYSALGADGGSEKPCGWVTDKFGIYWQVFPKTALRLMDDLDSKKADRVRQAMYRMHRIVIADLEAVYAGNA